MLPTWPAYPPCVQVFRNPGVAFHEMSFLSRMSGKTSDSLQVRPGECLRKIERLPSRATNPQQQWQTSATSVAAQNCRTHFSYQQNASDPQPSAMPAAAQSRQDDEIPTIQSGNIQAQQNAQHYTALLGNIEHNCQNDPQPQLTSVSLLSTACNLVHNRPVGARGLEPLTSTMSTWRSDQLS